MGISNVSNGYAGGGGGPTAVVPGTVIDNLVSISAVDALSANMGRVLNNKIEAAAIGVQLTVLANGQTAFSLPALPKNAASVILEINGVEYRNPYDFTVAGVIVTWLNGFTLKTTDIVFMKEFT